jgi:acetyltransferase-like isoleucine patch superfamily enzyme
LRNDHKPYALKRLLGQFEHRWVEQFIRPQLDQLGPGSMIMKPWYLKLYGSDISFGDAVHVVTSRDRTVRLTTWAHDHGAGTINIGDYALLCPGVRIDSATSISIGTSTMLAAGVYVTDADWHGIYDRTRPIGSTKAIVLRDNVWIGDGSIVCKGVTIGENTIVGAGSVVSKSLPANVIAAGNPAVVVKQLDPDETLVTRQNLLAEHEKLSRDVDQLERTLRKTNSWWGWLRAMLAPTTRD